MTVNIPYQTLGALISLGVGGTAGLCFFMLSLFKMKKLPQFVFDFLLTMGILALFLFCLQKTQNGDIKFHHLAVAFLGFLSVFCPIKKLQSFLSVKKKLKTESLNKENLNLPKKFAKNRAKRAT